LKILFRNIIVLFVLCFCVTVNAFAQNYKLKTKSTETDLKIIDKDYYFFMDRKDVVAYIKKISKAEHKNLKIEIKKMKGVCFESINLNKQIDDVEITSVQNLLKTKIVTMALRDGKIAVQNKKSQQFLQELKTTSQQNTNTMQNTIQTNFIDKDSNIIYSNSILNS
jgi:hypothetical protein